MAENEHSAIASASKKGTKRKGSQSSQTVESLLTDIESLTGKLKSTTNPPNTKKAYAKDVFKYGSISPTTGRREVHCPSRYKPKKSDINVIDGLEDPTDEETNTLPESFMSDITTTDGPGNSRDESTNELNELLVSCNSLIKDLGLPEKTKVKSQTWSERTEASLSKWESCRETIQNVVICAQQIDDETRCNLCNERNATIVCKQCRKTRLLCFICDDVVHLSDPCHDRLAYLNGHLQKLNPCQGLSESGTIINIARYPVLVLPKKCEFCSEHAVWKKLPSTQECIVITCNGRFDFLKFLLECSFCGNQIDVFKDFKLMINSRYWPGSIESISYLFDEDLFALWDSYRLHMPGSSENGFIESLVDISLQNNRTGKIQSSAFSRSFKEYEFCQYELNLKRGIEPFDCPACDDTQLAAMFDGNMKLYRYKSAGRKTRASYYKEKFICCNKSVDSLVKEIYKKPRSSQLKNVDNLCGSSLWHAARNAPHHGGTRDETGLELVSCRHCIAQKAVNMFRGEIFGYAYFLQRNHMRNIKFYFGDVACKYWKWLENVDNELYQKQVPAIGMLHVKGHSPSCEVIYGGLWRKGSCYTIGEEDEQIFSYLSRTGTTTKHMKPEHREEALTEFAMFWNERKFHNMPNSLLNRFCQVGKKLQNCKAELNEKIVEKGIQITGEMLDIWKREAISHAQASQENTVDIQLSSHEEYILLAIFLSECGKIPDINRYAYSINNIDILQIKTLKIRQVSKAVQKLQKRFVDLNNKLIDSTTRRDFKKAFDELAIKLLRLSQCKAEALFYSNIHISNNIGRLTDTCKKRRILRLKVARQKNDLKQIIQEYNSNVSTVKPESGFPVCNAVELDSGKFPWISLDSSITEIKPEERQNYLVTSLLIERLEEEKRMLVVEMKSYLAYYSKKVMPLLKERIKSLEGCLQTYCIEKEPQSEQSMVCQNFRERRGLLSLALQGLHYSSCQIQRGSEKFSRIMPGINYADIVQEEENSSDSFLCNDEDDDDEEVDYQNEEDIDENTLSVEEAILSRSLPQLPFVITCEEGVNQISFPLEVCQSLLDGRNGSNACVVIDLLFGNTFSKLELSVGSNEEFQTRLSSLVCQSIRNGNTVYDRSFFDQSKLPDIEEVASILFDEDIFPVIENIYDIEMKEKSGKKEIEKHIAEALMFLVC